MTVDGADTHFTAESVYNQTVAVSCCYSSDSWCQLWSLLVACATFVCRVTQIMRKVIDIFPQTYRVSPMGIPQWFDRKSNWSVNYLMLAMSKLFWESLRKNRLVKQKLEVIVVVIGGLSGVQISNQKSLCQIYL